LLEELVRLAHEPSGTPPIEQEIAAILTVVRQVLGVDFTQYNFNLLLRRIRHRMGMKKVASLADYREYLQESPREVDALYQDILSSTTSFFRNPDCFAALERRVFPKLFSDRAKEESVRVWVLGCSTGEEAYSLAIALTEFAEEQAWRGLITIYATDLNNSAIERARTGLFSRNIEHRLKREQLRRFFSVFEGGYRVNKQIRDCCIFARHNALSDPPFPRIDLISCRNLLSSLEPILHERLLLTLHSALKPHGFLFLGASELPGQQSGMFRTEDAKHRIYSKQPLSGHSSVSQSSLRRPHSFEAVRCGPSHDVHTQLLREAERVLLSRFGPTGVLINANDEVLYFRGDAGLYLTPAPGQAGRNLLKMAREGLLASLRTALLRARQKEEPATEEGIWIRTGSVLHLINLSVIPVRHLSISERWYWVLFEAKSTASAEPLSLALGSEDRAPAATSACNEQRAQLVHLAQELRGTRSYLQSVIEQQEAAYQELHFANEQQQSINEELKSLTEELETSRELLRASHEELSIVNEQLRGRIQELSATCDELISLCGSMEMAVVAVWRDLRIRRFTPLAQRLLNLSPPDVGRPLSDIKPNLKIFDLTRLLCEVLAAATMRELLVEDLEGQPYLLRICPSRNVEGQLDGAVLALISIKSVALFRMPGSAA